MSKKVVSTKDAPAAIGPYSQAIDAGSLIFCSGQIPLDPASMQMIEGDVKTQTRQVMKNLQAVLKAAGSDLGKVVKTTVFLQTMNDFAEMNGVYEEFFKQHDAPPPARSTVAVAGLPKNARVEIECVALK